ncbi:MAG: succinate dehydrogenase/fumarate reductase iron-sulfur subunit [Thermodesulfobacteriota bacterium]
MLVTFRVFRMDPARDSQARYQEFRLEARPWERILDCLNRIRWEQDPTLAFRSSCGHGICGSDGMRINGVCALACQRLVRDYPEGLITVEPLPNFRVLRDLVVDLGPFFQKYQAVMPYLINREPVPERERLQSPAERETFDEAIRCILCACCSAGCPVTAKDSAFLGPAALLRAFRYLFDSRDKAAGERTRLLDGEHGIWGCKGHGVCTQVCPKEIDVRKWLGRIKKRIHDSRAIGGEDGSDGT